MIVHRTIWDILNMQVFSSIRLSTQGMTFHCHCPCSSATLLLAGLTFFSGASAIQFRYVLCICFFLGIWLCKPESLNGFDVDV
jgi:hypothetical protein